MIEWTKFMHNLPTKPKLLRLAVALKVNRAEAVGLLLIFWAWCRETSEDGWLRKTGPEMVDAIMDRPGFAGVLVSIGWLEERGPDLRVPEWDEHLSNGAKERAMAALRNQNSRSKRNGTVSGDTPAIRSKRNGTVSQSVTRGEERREEEIRKDSQSPGGESESGEPSASKPPQGKLPGSYSSALPTPPCPPSPSVGAVGRPEGAERSGGIVDESKGFPGEQLSPYQLERMEAAGKLPHLRAFKAAYPPGRTKKKGPIRELWWRKGCEANPGPVMAGLARWNACDDWRGGYADAAENFLENEQWLDQPPDAKRVNPRDQQAAKAVEGAARVRSAEETWAAFERLGRDGQAAVLERVYERAPGLRGLPAGTDAVRVEVFRELKRERQTA